MSATKNASTGIVIGGEPRIDFLPSEVKARKQVRKTRRSLILLSLLAVAVCVAGYVFSAGFATLAQAKLAEEQAHTQALLKEQAEYGAVRTVTRQIAATEDARLIGSATEVLWKNYLAELGQALPDGVTIDKYTVTAQSATDLTPVPSVLLQNARVASITFSVRMPALADAETVLNNLKGLPGYADAWVTPIQVSPDAGYTADFTLNVNSDVLEKRFFSDTSESKED